MARISVLYVNPVEFHGPHLPLTTDFEISRGLWKRLQAELTSLKIPVEVIRESEIHRGCDPAHGPGTEFTTLGELSDLLIQTCEELLLEKPDLVLIMTFHGAPKHAAAIETAIRFLKSKNVAAFNPFNLVLRKFRDFDPNWVASIVPLINDSLVRRNWAQTLPQDFHGGLFETSVFMALDPSAVSPDFRLQPDCPERQSALPFRILIRLLAACGLRTASRELAIGADALAWMNHRTYYGYTGRPRLASPAIGNAFIQIFLKDYADTFQAVLQGREESPRPILQWTLSTFLQTPKRKGTSDAFLIFMLGTLNAVTPFTIDLYLPAFPQISQSLRVPVAQVALSISTYFLGFALGQLLYGPLLDRYGRRRPIYFGLSLYLVATLGCAWSTSIEMLLVLRFIQALGGSVSSVAATAMVRDFFTPEKSARVFSLMMLVLSTSPLLAPSMGGLIAEHFGWRALFYTLAGGTSLVLLMACFLLPEGHEPDPLVTLRPGPILRSFAVILRNRDFLTHSLSGSLAFAGLFVYLAGSPSIFMDTFHVSAQAYGGIFGILASGMIGGSQLNLLLGKRFRPEQIFKGAVIAELLMSSIFFVGVYQHWYGLTATVVVLFFTLLATGLTFPNAGAIALAPFKQNAGRAAALLGFMQLGLGAILSSGVGFFDYQGSLPTAVVMLVSSALALMVLIISECRQKAHSTHLV